VLTRNIKRMRALSGGELRMLLADPLLRWMILLPFLISLILRGLLPLMLERIGLLTEGMFSAVYPALAAYILAAFGPMVAGMVIGFLMLDQRDEGSLLAIRVTPLPPGLYIAYRLAWPLLVGMIATLLAFPLAGDLGLNGWRMPAAVMAAAPLAPVVALGLATFAANKVQGFALVKASSLLLAAPLAALWLAPTWHLPLAVIPTYWIARSVWGLQAGDPHALTAIYVAWAYTAVLTILLVRRFNRG
jgi:fluoroquinolone transport system permease protein